MCARGPIVNLNEPYMSKTMLKIQLWLFALLFFALFFLVPAVAGATTYNYDCADLTSGDSPSCTDGVWTKGSAFSLLKADDSKPFVAGTWYFNGVVGGSGTPFRLTCYEYSSGTCNTYVALSAGTYVDEAFVINSGTSLGLYLWGQSSTNPEVGEICITDELGGCDGGGGGGGSTAPSIFDDLFGSATSSASSTISIVFDPNRDMANLLFLFTAWFFGVYWIFSKKR